LGQSLQRILTSCATLHRVTCGFQYGLDTIAGHSIIIHHGDFGFIHNSGIKKLTGEIGKRWRTDEMENWKIHARGRRREGPNETTKYPFGTYLRKRA